MEHDDGLEESPSAATEWSPPLEIRIRLDLERLRELSEDTGVCPDTLARELDRVVDRQPVA